MELPGKRIAKWREHKGLSVRQLSDLADIPYSTLKTIESNENAEKGKPSFEVLAKLRKTFPDLNIDWILDETEPMLRDGRTLTKEVKQDQVLPGGRRNKFGAIVREPGELDALLPAGINEDVDQARHTSDATPTTQKEFIASLLKELDADKATIRNQQTILSEQQHTIRQLHKTNDFMQAQIEGLQAQIMELVGKEHGNHTYAPEQPTEANKEYVRTHKVDGFMWYARETAEPTETTGCLVLPLWAQEDIVQPVLSLRKAA